MIDAINQQRNPPAVDPFQTEDAVSQQVPILANQQAGASTQQASQHNTIVARVRCGRHQQIHSGFRFISINRISATFADRSIHASTNTFAAAAAEEALRQYVCFGHGWAGQLHEASPTLGWIPVDRLWTCGNDMSQSLPSNNSKARRCEAAEKRSQGSDTDESNDDDHPPKADAEVDNLSAVPSYKQGMTGQEVKALGRKIPWRKILEILHRKVPDADPERSWQLVDMAGCWTFEWRWRPPHLHSSPAEASSVEKHGRLPRQIVVCGQGRSGVSHSCLGSFRP